MDGLLPEAIVGLYDGTAGLDPGVGARQGHGAVVQERGQVEGGDLLTLAAQWSSVWPLFVPALWVLAAMESKQLEMRAAVASITGMCRYSMSGQRVHHLQEDVDDGADVVGEEQEVAVGGPYVTEVEVGGDPRCWGRARWASRAAAIGVCWLCLETRVQIHPALSPPGPHHLADPGGRGLLGGAPHGNHHHTHNGGWRGPWRSGAAHGLASPSSRRPRAGSSAGSGVGLGGPHTILELGDLLTILGLGDPHTVLGLGDLLTILGLGGPHNGLRWGTLTPSWDWGTFSTSWGRGTLTMAWAREPSHQLGLGDLLHGLGLWEQVHGVWLSTPLHPALCDTKPLSPGAALQTWTST